jgi:hypothetical protein
MTWDSMDETEQDRLMYFSFPSSSAWPSGGRVDRELDIPAAVDPTQETLQENECIVAELAHTERGAAREQSERSDEQLKPRRKACFSLKQRSPRS